eukprot:TRINITY_DN21747_c0_g3_i1.p1 TRINITY_DN21747_c0_g3~~TRINITY_DN21747_c0_g3_i1.p1  ORF type:complete len:310 (-),score=64.18 TRINITY_DN21747_c0_g3_i1:254-1087(-)
MALQLQVGEEKLPLDPAQELFSGDVSRVSAALSMGLKSKPKPSVGIRLFQNYEAIHPAKLSEMKLLDSRNVQLSEALAAALISGGSSQHSVLKDLQRLQAFAAGDSEKLAGRLLSELQKQVPTEGIASLQSASELEIAASYVVQGPRDHSALIAAHVKEGRRLLSLAVWSERDIKAAKRWLNLFRLGRGAFQARVALSFARCLDEGSKRKLTAKRYIALHDLLPLSNQLLTTSSSSLQNLWVCITVVGLEPCEVSEIESCGSELEDLARLYQEMSLK